MNKVKHKSLRQLAKEMGVSHSYLSQVRHGKRPPSEKVVSKMVSSMVSSGKQTSDDLEWRSEPIHMVGVRGLEPPTSASQTLRANHLRYTPLPKI